MALVEFRPMMERCSNCSSCKWIPFDKVKSQRFAENCPSSCYYQYNTYSARGRFQLAQTLLDGRSDYTDTVVDVIHNCLTCGACDISCKVCRYNLEPLEHNLELKASAIEEGKLLPQQQLMMDNLRKEGSMLLGVHKADRMDWARNLALKDLFQEDAEVAFFAGCKYSYDPDLQKIAQAAVGILLDAGVDLGTLGSADNCCAGRAFQMGLRDEFYTQADINNKIFQRAGVKTIVTPCSDCYHSFKRLYAQNGSNTEVLHIVEYLDRLIKQGKIKLTTSIPMKVTYHDPCHLGRLGEPYIPWNGEEHKILNQIHTWEPRRPRNNGAHGIYDAPREILDRIPGIEFVEMERIREYAWCCGAGGGCSETSPDFSSWTAGERVAEARATGAEALVTACPWCNKNFQTNVGENGKKIKVIDIIELVQRSIGGEGK